MEEGSISHLYGNLTGLKPSQIKKIERIYRKRVDPQQVISPEVARLLAESSFEIRRQIGILVGRRGNIEIVVVGDPKGITIPDLSRFRTGIFRLRNLRLIHTHLQGERLSQEDLTDLALLRLDMVAVLLVDESGLPDRIQCAHLLPENREKKTWEITPQVPYHQWNINFAKWIQALEEEFQRGQRSIALRGPGEKAILISVGTESRDRLERSMEELKSLAESSGVSVAEVMIQRPQQVSPTTLLGEGKLRELLVKCMQSGVDLILFDQNLTPGQMAAISDRTELRVIDRTQLILDIFAQRAHTIEGKIQVELAQLQYLLPRLARKTLALSRLTGGIGGRGPGETKLEIDRRRVRERIHLLEKELERMQKGREQRRAKRIKAEIPIVSIIGYTNAGKSTLFNQMTRSHSLVEDRLFATLDPATRKWRTRQNRGFVLTDTVGFIKNLPKDLMVAFRPTFDELRDARLFLHLIDISTPFFEEHIETVDTILRELALDHIRCLRVFNKEDKLHPETVATVTRKYGGIAISSLRPESLHKLFQALEKELGINLMVHPRFSHPRLTNGESFDISDKTAREVRNENGIST